VFRLSLRTSLALALVVLNVGLTAVVATFAYRAAHDVMVDQSIRSVAEVARSRERELQDLLERRQQRLEGFLASLESLCAERNPSGTLGIENQCLRAAVIGLHRSERATTTDIRYRERRRVLLGEPLVIDTPLPTHLVKIKSVAGRGRYAMRATRGDLAVEVQFDLDDINGIFEDRAGLDVDGETFLTDAFGYRLTNATYPSPTGFPVDMSSIGQCLDGSTQATLTTDYRGVDVISGVRPTSIGGGGCIVANVTYDTATLPVTRLGSMLAYAAGMLGLLGGIVSAVVAGLVTGPIKRLAVAARALADGNLDAPVPVAGTSEVRQLGQTLSHMAASIRDLVHREQTARLHAEAASRTKDDFLATLSHELRTPLNAILGWSSILARTDQDRSRVSHAVRVIERNARVQSQMVEELLDVSRIATGRVRLSVSDVLIAPAIEAALESVRPAADAKNVVLRTQIDQAARMTRADPRRLQQIIWNLLSNAVRFTPAGGQVDVIARPADLGFLEIVVADTGCGIVPEFLPHVFERFRQGDSSTTRTHGGLGLGLAIVHDLVGMHGGTVRAESAGAGQGTTFAVRLPAVTPRDILGVAPASSRLQPRLTGASVLVVDDDPDAREVLRTILEDAGAQVTTSSSARETREILCDLHPDLLIADIGMPEEDGYSLILSIRNLETGPDHVPAIALTAHTRPEDVEHALASGFQMHMAKPIDSTRLVASIASLFESAS
jgi:signal transduction histidine kinase/ActR/RegA family two-component response regulator